MKARTRTLLTALGCATALWAANPARAASPAPAARPQAAPAASLKLCAGCHDITPAKKKKLSVPLFGLYGKKPLRATIKAAKWDDKALDRFLADPARLDPATKMKFKVKDPRKRAQIIAAMKKLK